MSYRVTEEKRENGQVIIGCSYGLHKHAKMVARPSAEGLWLWCNSCMAERLYDWPAVLGTMTRQMSRAEMVPLLQPFLPAFSVTAREPE